jgi:DNA helicase-2/ATP-dependent DNA helicase PcrA
MPGDEIDLLEIDQGLVVAPAGCGKTQLIVDALSHHDKPKPILVLTHTNAGVAALRTRLKREGVNPSSYRLATIDGWAIRLISMFPQRAAHDPQIIQSQRPNYPKIREAAFELLKAGHINDVIEASYTRLLVDEYQDCSIRQHYIVGYASDVIPTCVVGDPMQAIFDFGNDQLADWDKHVCGHFERVAELNQPWRWINAKSEELGQWLLDVRRALLAGEGIDMKTVPRAIHWIQLDGSASDHAKLLRAGRVNPPDGVGSVLIIGDSTSPASQQKFASKTPGAVTVESVDLRDLVSFAQRFNIGSPEALLQVGQFAQGLMTSVGAADLIRRVGVIARGTARKEPNDVEHAALAFEHERSFERVADLLVAINKDAGVRVYRPAVLRACLRALEMCSGPNDVSFHESAMRVREQSRFQGRTLPKRAVGSTLLLKGLEAEVVVVLNADPLNARNLYVAMTRGSKQLTLCSKEQVLKPSF